MSLKLKIRLFLVALFVTSIGNVLLVFMLESYTDKKLEWVNHTHEVIIESKSYFGYLKDIETGQRGYLITHDVAYLKPYYIALSNIKESLDRLKALTKDNFKQQKSLINIQKNTKLKLIELKKTIDLVKERNYKEATLIVLGNSGKEYMDAIRMDLNKFISVENILLEKRKGDFRADKAQIMTLIAMEILIFIFVAIMSMFFFNRNLFDPLRTLLKTTQKTRDGEKAEVSDILPNDEMGYLIANLFKMNEIVIDKVENLDYKANHDALTGLKNRTKLFSDIEEGIAKQEGESHLLAVIFIDLNNFKPINDTIGHSAGDDVLVETAKRLKHSVRTEDEIYRTGGDEFVILSKKIDTQEELEKMLNRILDTFKVPFMVKEKSLEISLSIGVSLSPDDGTDPDELINRADIAMYCSKKNAKSTYKFFHQTMLKRTND